MKRLLIAAIAGLFSVSAHAQTEYVLFEPWRVPAIHDGIEYIEDGDMTASRLQAIRGLQVDGKVYDVRFEYGTFTEFDAQGKMAVYHDATGQLAGKVNRAILGVLDAWFAFGVGNPSRGIFAFVWPDDTVCLPRPEGIVCATEFREGEGPRIPDLVSWGDGDIKSRSKDFTDLYATIELISVTTTVAIDIEPHRDNKVNLTNVKINVAVLMTDDFDASTIDIGTVRFGPGEALPVYYRYKDTDGDGDLDLLMRFLTADTDIACGDTSVTLTGQTFDGMAIEGTVLDIYTRDSRKDGVKCQP